VTIDRLSCGVRLHSSAGAPYETIGEAGRGANAGCAARLYPRDQLRVSEDADEN
jgi:hypothetical protein